MVLYKTFSRLGLTITVQSNLKVANVLDVTLDLPKTSPPLWLSEIGQPPPPLTPTPTPHVQSNHPPPINKNLPVAIGSRISSLSCDQAEFDKAEPTYSQTLKASGYQEQINRTEENIRKGQGTQYGLTHHSVETYKHTSEKSSFSAH